MLSSRPRTAPRRVEVQREEFALRAWERTDRPVAAVGAQLRDEIIFVVVALSKLYFLVGWVWSVWCITNTTSYTR